MRLPLPSLSASTVLLLSATSSTTTTVVDAFAFVNNNNDQSASLATWQDASHKALPSSSLKFQHQQRKPKLLLNRRCKQRLFAAHKSQDQLLHTAERIAGMSRGEIQHIFDDVDVDGSGSIDMTELDFLLSQYFIGDADNCDIDSDKWTCQMKRELMMEIDTNGNGTIDAEEFYNWMVVNATNVGTVDERGTKALERREERLDLGKMELPTHLKELLEELGIGAVVQQVTHPLHSAFGRTLYDHFVSCYILAKQWGNPDHVAEAALFHALYQRGDGMRAVDFAEYRPKLQKLLGKDVEELIYLFPSTHKSAILEDGLLTADITTNDDLIIPNVLEGGTVNVPAHLRPALVELEVINSHDQNLLENCNPVHNLWEFYQHATVIPIMSDGAKRTIIEFQKRAHGANCDDIVQWHTRRYEDVGKEMPDMWKKHLDMFRRPGGKFACAEDQLKEMADRNGDGKIDWEEFQGFDWDQCFL